MMLPICGRTTHFARISDILWITERTQTGQESLLVDLTVFEAGGRPRGLTVDCSPSRRMFESIQAASRIGRLRLADSNDPYF